MVASLLNNAGIDATPNGSKILEVQNALKTASKRGTGHKGFPEYVAYYFRSNEGRKLMSVLAQGVTRYNMSKSAFNNATILMPLSATEQKAIADVLKCMDNEISALKAKKGKYEQIKQGMMQQLLTGKIRLI